VDFTTVWLAVTKRAPMKQRKLLSATLRRFHFTWLIALKKETNLIVFQTACQGRT